MFQKATKEQAKLRLAIAGPSGSGKTYTALNLAKHLGERVALIDTEHGSASKYADKFNFDVADLSADKSVFAVVQALEQAGKSGYDVVIIDSLTHPWRWLTDHVEKIAQTKFRGNTWSAWSEGNPIYQKLIDAVLSFPGHVIGTTRSKTEWVVEQTSGGKSAPRRVGTAPEQRQGFEYEFDVFMEMTIENVAHVSKARAESLQGGIFDKPGEELAGLILEWLNDGSEPRITPEQLKYLAAAVRLAGLESAEDGLAFTLWAAGAGSDVKSVKSLPVSAAQVALDKFGEVIEGEYAPDTAAVMAHVEEWRNQ